MNTTKQCAGCQKRKPLTSFTTLGGIHTSDFCVCCQAEYRNDKQLENKQRRVMRRAFVRNGLRERGTVS